MKIEVDVSDLKKLEQALHEAYMHHLHRDEMNGRIHLAKSVIQSPLTTLLQRAWERCDVIIKGYQVAETSDL
jgi:hypothetical protein